MRRWALLWLLLAACGNASPSWASPLPTQEWTVAPPLAHPSGRRQAQEFIVLAPGAAVSDAALTKCFSGGEDLRASVQTTTKVLQVSQNALIMPDGTLLSLESGLVPESERRGALITKLFDHLIILHLEGSEVMGKSMDAGSKPPCPGVEHRPELLVVAARDVPTSTIEQVVYTASQAHFTEVHLAVQAPASEAPSNNGAPARCAAAAQEGPPRPESVGLWLSFGGVPANSEDRGAGAEPTTSTTVKPTDWISVVSVKVDADVPPPYSCRLGTPTK